MESLKEIIQFLQIGARLDLKSVALQNILDLTGNKDSLELILQSEDILNSLIVLLHDPNNVISKDSSLTLVNLSANEKGAEILINLIPKNDVPLMKSPDKLIKCCLNFISDQNSHLSDHCCAILSNLTRPSSLTDKIIDQILETEYSFDKLINIFTTIDYNKKGAKLHYLGPVFSNLSQSNRVRKYLLDEKKCVIQRLLPFTEYKESSIRRGGIVGTLRNCCFEDDYHKWLLSDSVDILPRLLLPLAGAEEFDDEDNEKLPIELQYLSEDKKREIDPDIRMMLLEALTHLCAKKENRVHFRERNVYVILRELHKWEKDSKALLACENLVDILIRTEEEIGQDNLKELEVPRDLQEKFQVMNTQFLEEK